MGEIQTSIKVTANAATAVRQFSDLKRSVGENEKAFQAATAEVAALAKQMRGAGPPTAEMVQQFERAKTRAGELKQSLTQQNTALEQHGRQLKASGVDVANLAGEYSRLKQRAAALSDQARQRTRLTDARKVLGLPDPRTVERDVQQIKSAFQRLKDSGTLSQREIGQAAITAKSKIIELRRGTGDLVEAFKQVKVEAAGLAAVTFGFGRLAVGGARDQLGFERKIAEISTLTEKGPQQLGQLGEEIRALSQQIGKDATDLADATYNLLSAGVPEDGVVNTLELASKAAVAGVTDVNSAAKLGIGVVNAYGLGIEHMEGVFDVLFQTVRNGVTTIPALAASLGEVMPSARTAGVGLEELTAALAQLTKGGIRTPQAITGLKSAILQLAAPTPEAAKRLKELGIEWNGLIGTLEQIKAQNLDLAGLRGIIPDAEGASAVDALVASFDDLKGILDDNRQAAGAMDAAFDKVAGSNPAAMDRWTATWAEFRKTLGELLVMFTPFVETMTALLAMVNELPGPLKVVIGSLAAMRLAITLFNGPLNLLVTALRGLATQTLKDVTTQANATTRAMTSLRNSVNLLFAGAAGYSIGSYFYEQFEVVRATAVAAVGLVHEQVERLVHFFKTIPLKLRTNWRETLNSLRTELAAFADKAANKTGLFPDLSAAMRSWRDGLLTGVAGASAQAQAELNRLEEEHRQALERIKQNTQNAIKDAIDPNWRQQEGTPAVGGPLPPPTVNGGNPFANGAGASGTGDAGAEAVAGLERQIALLGRQTEYERTLWEVQKGRYKDLSAGRKQALLDAAQRLDQGRAEQALDQAAEQLRDQLDPMQQVRDQLEQYDALLRRGKISWEEWSEATLQAHERLDALNDTAGKSEPQLNQMTEMAKQAGRTIQSSFADFLFDPFQDGLKGMLRGFVDTIRRMVAEALAAKILQQVGSFGAGLGGPIGSIFGVLSAGVRHSGGAAGSGPRRLMPAAAFIGAPQFHNGSGVLGLKPDEVPAILQTGERVQSRAEVAAGQRGAQSVRVVVVDDRSAIADYLATPAGEQAVIQTIRRNAMTVGNLVGR